MRKLLSIITISLILISALTSCYDAHEIDDMAFVMSIGVDRGITDKWRLTVKIPTMSSEQSSGGDSSSMDSSSTHKSGYNSITVEAPSFFTGINMLNTFVPRRLNFEHTKFLIFSEEIARSGIVGEFLAPIVRYRQIRRTLHVIIARGSAMEFVNKVDPYIGSQLSKSEELLIKESEDTGFFPHITLYDLNNGIKSTYRQPIAILGAINEGENFVKSGSEWGDQYKTGGDYLAGQLPRTGGFKAELFGCAIASGDKMVGELDGTQTRMMLIARGDFKRGFFTIPDPIEPKLIIPLDVRTSRQPRVKVHIDDKGPRLYLKVFLDASLLAVQSRINYESKNLKPVLEQAFASHIKKELETTIKKCIDLNVDVFKFGEIAVRQFNTIQDWEDYNWLKRFKTATIKVDVDFNIDNTGTMLKSASIRTERGKE